MNLLKTNITQPNRSVGMSVDMPMARQLVGSRHAAAGPDGTALPELSALPKLFKLSSLPALLTLLLTLLLSLLLSSCTDTTTLPDPPTPEINNTFITLSADIADPSSPKSRAEFEAPAYGNERIRTMRFIIVRPDNTVEYNIHLTGDAENLTENDTIISTTPLIVAPNETKTVYLIGNEASLSSELQNKLKYIARGDAFKADEFKGLTIDMEGSGPLYTAEQPIPMTEIHNIAIGDAPAQDGDKGTRENPYTYNLFVTRAAVKFTFNLKVTHFEKYSPADYSVTDITFNEIGNKEYLFPTKTVYDPAKPETAIPDEDYKVNREITSYSVPVCTKAPYTFSWVDKTPDLTQDEKTYTAGPVYLPETLLSPDGTTPYSITLPFCGMTFKANLDELPIKNGLARNTHVIINISFENAQLALEVILQPYTGVWLNPGFGINRD